MPYYSIQKSKTPNPKRLPTFDPIAIGFRFFPHKDLTPTPLRRRGASKTQISRSYQSFQREKLEDQTGRKSSDIKTLPQPQTPNPKRQTNHTQLLNSKIPKLQTTPIFDFRLSIFDFLPAAAVSPPLFTNLPPSKNYLKNMKQKLLLLNVFAILAVVGANAQTAAGTKAKLVEKVTKTGDELVIPYEKYVLPNGLTLIIHEDHSDPIVHTDITYHVGSAREEIGKSGFAHFFEHMMFQGSDHVADEQHFKIVTESGGSLNGTTNLDRTNYFETVPSNQLEKTLWLEADRMGFLLDAVTQQKFEIQRETVKNERGQGIDNVPYGLAQEVIVKNMYPYGHPYSWLTIGYIEDLNRVNVNDLKNFFLRWYGPNNATVTVGGDVDPKQVVSLVEKYFGTIPSGPKVENMPANVPKLDKHRFVSYTDNYARMPVMVQSFPTVQNYHKDMAALDCLAEILGQGNNSVLYQQLVKKQLALAANVNHTNYELSGDFTIQVVPYPGKTLASMYNLVNNALDSFEARGITDEDISKFKGQIEAQYFNSLASVSGKVSRLASYQTFTGNPNMIGKELDMYRAVTKEDVMRVYKQYVRYQHPVVLSILTKGQDKVITGNDNYVISKDNYTPPHYGYDGLTYVKAKDNFDRSVLPAAGPNPVVKVPAFWRKDLDGGIKVIGAENNELATVTLVIKVPGGHLMQANDLSKAGLSSFVATMMNQDTKTRSAEDFSKELEKLGSTISVTSGLDGISFQVFTLKKNLDATMALLEERVLTPKFKEDAFSRLKRQRLESFKQSKSQPATIATNAYNVVNYGTNNILGISQNGTEESVKNITLQDIQAYYDNNMTSNGVSVVVVGDAKEAEILPKLAFLGKLPNKKIEIPSVASGIPAEKTKIYLIDVKNAAQSEYRVGYVTNLKYDATGEYYKAMLTNFALGGAFNSRLNLNLREDKGWTYGASSAFSGDKYTGRYTFSSGIKGPSTDSALIEIMKEMKNYSTQGIKDEELVFLKSALGQVDALRYETGIQKGGFIARILEYNLPADFVDKQNEILKNITKSDINALAQKWINADKMNIVVVGDKNKILPGLQKLGYEIVELDVDGKPVEKKAF
jgi:zinc protease